MSKCVGPILEELKKMKLNMYTPPVNIFDMMIFTKFCKNLMMESTKNRTSI